MKLTPMRRDPSARGSAKPSGERKIKYWRAPMDPTYISDKPGKSPMGMDLVPVYENEVPATQTIAIDPVTIQNMAIRTAILTNGPLRRVIRTVAAIEPDETSLADVTTKFTGWAEKLYVDATGAQVQQGDPLFEVYSPELYSAQIEYLLALKTAETGDVADTLLTTARTKLKYWDISDAQIEELERTREPQKTLKILAPINGFVLEKNLIEGQMINPGKRLYRIADLSRIWVLAQIYEQDLPYLQLGQKARVTLPYLPDRRFRGRVTYIYPNLDLKTRTVRVRLEFPNPDFLLKPGMFASVEITAELAPSVLLVPDMAVLRSGARNTVFVTLPGGKFAPRDVRLGARAENDLIQVLSGLRVGERVVISGQFLLDSESQLREAVQKMLEPNPATATSQPESQNSSVKPTPPLPTLYTCPMKSHAHVVSDHPGQCPECGMTLVKTSTVEHGKLAEAQWRKEHSAPTHEPRQSPVH
jgi:RND family efflux transporter MFP subunit